jgi:hypothetical protein
MSGTIRVIAVGVPHSEHGGPAVADGSATTSGICAALVEVGSGILSSLKIKTSARVPGDRGQGEKDNGRGLKHPDRGGTPRPRLLSKLMGVPKGSN